MGNGKLCLFPAARSRVLYDMLNPWLQNAPSRLLSAKLLSMRVLGVDCGGEYTGFGVVEGEGRSLRLPHRRSHPARSARSHGNSPEKGLRRTLGVDRAIPARGGCHRGCLLFRECQERAQAGACARSCHDGRRRSTDFPSSPMRRWPSSLPWSATAAPRSRRCRSWSPVCFIWTRFPSPPMPPTPWPLPSVTFTRRLLCCRQGAALK